MGTKLTYHHANAIEHKLLKEYYHTKQSAQLHCLIKRIPRSFKTNSIYVHIRYPKLQNKSSNIDLFDKW